jgi:hypothetical protein
MRIRTSVRPRWSRSLYKGWLTKGALERLQLEYSLRKSRRTYRYERVQWQQTGAGVYTKITNANQGLRLLHGANKRRGGF